MMKKLFIALLAAFLLSGCSAKSVSKACKYDNNGLKTALSFKADSESSPVNEVVLTTLISYSELGISPDDEEMKEVLLSTYSNASNEDVQYDVKFGDEGLEVSVTAVTKEIVGGDYTFKELVSELETEGFECK